MIALTFCPHSARKIANIPFCYIACFARSAPLKESDFCLFVGSANDFTFILHENFSPI